MLHICFQTILLHVGVIWLSLTQGAFVPRNQRSTGSESDFRPSPSSPSTLQSSLSNFNLAGFDEYNPGGGGVALPVPSYPFGFPTSGFDLTGLQLQPLQHAYSAPTGDFRFPGFGFDVTGYPFAVPPFVLRQYNDAPLQFSPAAGNDAHQLRALAETGLRSDAVPRALPAGNGQTRSLQPPVPVFVGQSTAGQTYGQRAPQTNDDVSAQYTAPNSAAVPPRVLNEVPPRQYYNQAGDERQVRVLTAGADFNVAPATDQPQPNTQTNNDLIATPSPGSLDGPEPVADLDLELRPPPYTAADANPDPSFSSSANGPSPQSSYPRPFVTDDPVSSGPGSASSASGPGPAVATPSPPSNVGSFDGTKNAPAPYHRGESYTTTPPAGLAPDAYPTPSISYSLPSETFHLPAGPDAYGSPIVPAADGPENAPDRRMNPIVVSGHSSHPVQVPSGTVSGGPDAGSSALPAGAGHYSAYGTSNPVSANTYSDSNAIQGSSHGNAAVHPKLIAGTFFVDSNSISSNGKRETSNADRSGKPPHRQPNGSE